MLFNLVAASLIVQGGVGKTITEPEYGLSITDIVMNITAIVIAIGIVGAVGGKSIFQYQKIYVTMVSLFALITISFSALVIDYQNNNKVVDDDLYNFSISFIALWILFLIMSSFFGKVK